MSYLIPRSGLGALKLGVAVPKTTVTNTDYATPLPAPRTAPEPIEPEPLPLPPTEPEPPSKEELVEPAQPPAPTTAPPPIVEPTGERTWCPPSPSGDVPGYKAPVGAECRDGYVYCDENGEWRRWRPGKSYEEGCGTVRKTTEAPKTERHHWRDQCINAGYSRRFCSEGTKEQIQMKIACAEAGVPPELRESCYQALLDGATVEEYIAAVAAQAQPAVPLPAPASRPNYLLYGGLALAGAGALYWYLKRRKRK